MYNDFRERGLSHFGEEYTEGDAVSCIQVNVTVEVKMNVSQISLGDKLLLRENAEEPIIAGLGFGEAGNNVDELINKEHLWQCVFPALVTKTDTFLYVCPAETGLKRFHRAH